MRAGIALRVSYMTVTDNLPDLVPGFATQRVTRDGVTLHARVGGGGPPLVCLHGYPQTHVCWHRVAPALAQHFTVVLADLRGYGASDSPPGDKGHEAYAKRTMAADIVVLMRALGHERFHVMGHDRGARVAYRLALDVPEAVDRLVINDVLPTIEVWDAMRAAQAQRSYHWSFLSQPYPLPETLIGGAPEFYIKSTLQSWTRDRTLNVFDAAALRHYTALGNDTARIHAMCEDYRAGATFDAAIDAHDRAHGRKITQPTFLVWGKHYLGQGGSDPLAVWRRWCDEIDGASVNSGHFQHEEAPDDLLACVLPFLLANS